MAGNALRTGIFVAAVSYFALVAFIFAREGGFASAPMARQGSASPTDHEIPGEGAWIVIPSIGVYASVASVGLTPAGNIGTPESYHDTAWFDGSATPGTLGTSIVVGHRDTRVFAPGVFRSLGALVPGDDVYVYRDGVRAHFKVRRAEAYPEDTGRMDEIMGEGAKGTYLNLITCEGAWNQAVRRYNKRLVVFTELTPD